MAFGYTREGEKGSARPGITLVLTRQVELKRR
jgi:hypothetical protein